MTAYILSLFCVVQAVSGVKTSEGRAASELERLLREQFRSDHNEAGPDRAAGEPATDNHAELLDQIIMQIKMATDRRTLGVEEGKVRVLLALEEVQRLDRAIADIEAERRRRAQDMRRERETLKDDEDLLEERAIAFNAWVDATDDHLTDRKARREELLRRIARKERWIAREQARIWIAAQPELPPTADGQIDPDELLPDVTDLPIGTGRSDALAEAERREQEILGEAAVEPTEDPR